MARVDPQEVIKLYEQAKTLRAGHENDWRMAAAYTLPSQYSAWQTDGPATFSFDMSAARRVNYDSTGARSLMKYQAVLNRIVTPTGQRWHGLRPSDSRLRKNRRVRLFFDEVVEELFRLRDEPYSRFTVSVNELYLSMGVYGNSPLYVGEREPRPGVYKRGVKYIACPIRDIFVFVDDNGQIVSVFRRFWLNVRQFKLKFPDAPLPSAMEAEGKKITPDETNRFEFVHYVCYHSGDYDEEALDYRRHPVRGNYLCVGKPEYVGNEAGYSSMPYMMPRTSTFPGDPYGVSPAVMALSSLGGASTIKKTNLQQGNLAAKPVLLAYDDGVLSGEANLKPGAVWWGAVDKQGNKLVHAMDTGNFRVNEVLLAGERKDIEDSFLVTLFSFLQDHPEMTATEVVKELSEQAALVAPVMAQLQADWAGPMVGREVELLAALGRLPEVPPELVEADGQYDIVYTSPLAKGQAAESVRGFIQVVDSAIQLAQATNDPSHLDPYNFEVAQPEIADILSVPARWMAAEDEIKAKRDNRAGQTQQSELLKNAPAIASAAKTVSEMGRPAK